MSWADWIGVLANSIIAVSAAGASIAAWRGLNTWQQQAEWEHNAETARKALITLYQYRNSLYSVRHPAMSRREMETGEPLGIEMPRDQIERRGVILAYANRIEKHASKRSELDAVLLETDAVWSTELSELIAPMYKLEHELFVYIRLFLDANYRGDTELAVEYRKILKTKRDIIYDVMSDEEDDFRKDFIEKLKDAEKYLKEKLGRR